jgi:programmed cell death protein 5
MSSQNPSDEGKPSDAEVEALKEQALRTLLSPEARSRLNNVKMVKPDLAAMVENYLLGLASQGRLNKQISDDQLKQILLSIQQPKRDFKINRR